MSKNLGKQLAQFGKRRCWKCKEIFPLTKDFFNKCTNVNRPTNFQFQYMCRMCGKRNLNKVRIELIEKSKNKCQKCGLFDEDISFFDIDHIIPNKNPRKRWFKLEPEDRNNLQVLCPNCHRRKTLSSKDFFNRRLFAYSSSQTKH